MASEVLLSLKNPVFAGYAYYGSIVILKKFSMALMTVGARLTKKVDENLVLHQSCFSFHYFTDYCVYSA